MGILSIPSLRPAAMALAIGLASLAPAHAVQFTLSGQSASTWTYTLTYDPLDNYAVNGAPETATIRLTGLSGVTSATGPTSTDFAEAFLDTINLNWSAAVLNGGTEVLWTHVGPGTGNFPDAKHVFGFSVTAPGATSGDVLFSTTGFSTDISNGYLPRDVRGVVSGPAAVPEPETWALLLAGLAVMGGVMRKQRHR